MGLDQYFFDTGAIVKICISLQEKIFIPNKS